MSEIIPCCDRQRRTCLQVDRPNGRVKYIPLDYEGLAVLTVPATEFDQRFQPMANYPADRACQLYLSYSQTIGATKEALNYLGQVITITQKEITMATKAKTPAAKKTPAKKAAAVKTPAKKTPTAKKAPAVAGERKPTASQMFQELIMAGNLTDDKIFEKVQAKFGLDEKKRGYVKWYRAHLKKLGTKDVPEAK